MACLKVGDIRRFAIFMNNFDAVVVRVNKNDCCYDVIDCNGLKRMVAFGSVVGKGSPSPEVREQLLRIAKEYTEMYEAKKMVLKYKTIADNHASTISNLRKELGNVSIN